MEYTDKHSSHTTGSKFNFDANSPHDFAAHVEHQLGLDVLAPDQAQYGGYAFINDDTIVARSPITGLRPVIEQAISQIVGTKTIEAAAKALGGFDNLESKIAQKLTQLNDWANLTQETQNEVMILTGINFDAMTAAEQEVSINHLQHSPLPFGDIKQVLAESVTIDMGYTHTLDKTKTVSEHVGDGIYKVTMISNNNNGSHTGHNLGSFMVDMNKYAAEDAEGQYANSVTASSNYSSASSNQASATGKPNGSPWYPKSTNVGDVTLELNYANASKVSGIELTGTTSYPTGNVTKVELKDADGNWHTVWTGSETSTANDKTLELNFDATDFDTQNARITIDTDKHAGWESIDAAKLVTAKSERDDGSGREAKAVEIGNQMVSNTNNNNELYLDESARDVLYGRTEKLDFSEMEHGGENPGTGHHFTEHVNHMFEGTLIETQEAYGGYSFINDNYIIARSPITGLQAVVEQAIDQIVGTKTLEAAAKAQGGYDKLESKIANQITNLNDWAQLTEATQAKLMIMTGINFDGMTKAEQEKSINHLQHSPLPFGEIEEVLSTSVKLELGYTHTLDKTKTEVKDLGDGVWEIKMISNNNNGSHTGHNLGSFKIDLGANGNADIAKQVGNQMVVNTNDNNKLYLDAAARDVLYGRVERMDFDMDNPYETTNHGEGHVNHVYGTDGDDALVGSDGNDMMHGKGGNDSFFGGKGDDQFMAAEGSFSEVEFAGNSADYKFTSNEDGTVTATHAVYGTDTLTNINSAWFRGDAKWYTVEALVEGIDGGSGEGGGEGGGEAGTINGTDGDDYLVGTDGDDVIKGGDGVDGIYAGAGDDVIDGEGGDYNEVELLGNSTDYTFTKNEDGSVTAVHAEYGTKTLSNIDGAWFFGDEKWSLVSDLLEEGSGGEGEGGGEGTGETGNTINGTDGDDYLVGTDSDDIILGGDGVDVMVGGKGNDTFDGGGGDYNQVNFEGKSADYTFTANDDGSFTAEHAEYGKDILKDIDGVWFDGDSVWQTPDEMVA